MRAIILAAGIGKRLRDSVDLPKCLVTHDGKTLLQHQLDAFSRLGVHDIHIILGYKSKAVADVLPTNVAHHVCQDFEATNNLWTLAAFSSLLKGDCIVSFADIRIDYSALKQLVSSDADIAVLGDGRQCLPGTMRIKARGEVLLDIGGHIPVEEGHGNFLGVAKFGNAVSSRLSAAINSLVTDTRHQQSYYTVALPELMKTTTANIIWMMGRPWIEIDDASDLAKASSMSFPEMS